MSKKQQEEIGAGFFLIGPILVLISLFFLIGSGAKGTGCFWFICLPGWGWGIFMLAVGAFLSLGGIAEIIDRFKKRKKRY